MPTWSYARPLGTAAWNIGGAAVRDNFQFLEQALQKISTFAINASDPLDRIGTKILYGATGARPATTSAAQEGLLYFDTSTSRLYLCTGGVGNLWIELEAFNDLTVAGTLTVGGTTSLAGVTVNGGLLALGGITVGAGNLTIGTGRKIDLPNPGEAVFRLGTDSMSVHAHGARHRPGHTDGAWTTPNDHVPFSIQRIVSTSSVENAGVDIPSTVFGSQNFITDRRAHVDLDTTGRPSATTRLLVYCELAVFNQNGDPDNQHVEIGLFLDAMGAQQGGSVFVAWDATTPGGDPVKTVSFWRYITGVTAGAHTLTIHAKDYAPAGATYRAYRAAMIVLDLGID